MLTPTIRQLITRVEQLENSLHAPEVERLEVWRDLITWLDFAKNFDTEIEALNALDPGDRLREIHQNLMWCLRYFVPLLPADIKQIPYWSDKAKMCIEHFILVGLDLESPDELSQEGYLHTCIEWTIEQLRDVESWREYDERQQAQRDQWKPKAQPVEEPEAQPLTTVINPVIQNPAIESKAEISRVTNGDIIEAKYIGGKTGFFIQTADGLMKIIKGQRYRLPGYVWQNIQEFSAIEWRKV